MQLKLVELLYFSFLALLSGILAIASVLELRTIYPSLFKLFPFLHHLLRISSFKAFQYQQQV